MSLIPAPRLSGGATEAFRIGDIRSKSAEFAKKLSDVLAAGPSSGVTRPATVGEISAADLRLPNEEESLRLLHLQATADAELDSDNSSDGEDENAERRKEDEPPPRGNEKGDGHRDRKKQIVETYAAAVEAMRKQKANERAKAAQYLKSVQATATAQEPPLKKRRQSFLSLTAAIPDVHPVDDLSGNSGKKVLNKTIAPGTQDMGQSSGGAVSGVSNGAHVPPGEVVIHVAVHLPQAPARVSEEWLVLGSQRLTELRDMLYCLTEVNIRNVEAGENRQRKIAGIPLMTLSKPSAYFYVEGTFYVDTRDKKAVDYSEIIRKHNKKHNVRAPPHPPPCPASQTLGAPTTEFSLDNLQDRCFNDLWVRLGTGAPGLYCHQGGCEHLLVFKDVRIHDPASDPPLQSQYPFKIATPSAILLQHKQCEACGLRAARNVTYDDSAVPHSPFFWCHDCFKMMHYGSDGAVLYTDFKVFPYTHDYQPMLMQVSNKKPPKQIVRRRPQISRSAREVGSEEDSEGDEEANA